jgi:hypothetical protein
VIKPLTVRLGFHLLSVKALRFRSSRSIFLATTGSVIHITYWASMIERSRTTLRHCSATQTLHLPTAVVVKTGMLVTQIAAKFGMASSAACTATAAPAPRNSAQERSTGEVSLSQPRAAKPLWRPTVVLVDAPADLAESVAPAVRSGPAARRPDDFFTYAASARPSCVRAPGSARSAAPCLLLGSAARTSRQ